jgi:hypothetical protein
MGKKRVIVVAIVLGILVMARPVIAHHSSAAFDLEHMVTVKGTVSNFEWSNPHTFIYLDVKDAKGNVEQWRIEGNSPNMLTRVGWKREMIQRGDQVSVTGAPAKNGTKVMRLASVTLTNGQTFDGQGFK